MKESKKYSFIDIINIIFEKKQEYINISDEDKENNFFIINRKFSRKYPQVGNMFNNKHVDKASVIDKWFRFFKNIYTTPGWYWGNKKNNKKTNNINVLSDDDITILREVYNLKKNDIDYLMKNFKSDLLKQLKKHKPHAN
jgi:hypothetical protein